MTKSQVEKDTIFQIAQEKFKSVDAVVIHFILSDYDFDLTKAEASLVEISQHAGLSGNDIPSPGLEPSPQTNTSLGWSTNPSFQPSPVQTVSNEMEKSPQNSVDYLQHMPSVYDSYYDEDKINNDGGLNSGTYNNTTTYSSMMQSNNVQPTNPFHYQQNFSWSSACGDEEDTPASELLKNLMQSDLDGMLQSKVKPHDQDGTSLGKDNTFVMNNQAQKEDISNIQQTEYDQMMREDDQRLTKTQMKQPGSIWGQNKLGKDDSMWGKSDQFLGDKFLMSEDSRVWGSTKETWGKVESTQKEHKDFNAMKSKYNEDINNETAKLNIEEGTAVEVQPDEIDLASDIGTESAGSILNKNESEKTTKIEVKSDEKAGTTETIVKDNLQNGKKDEHEDIIVKVGSRNGVCLSFNGRDNFPTDAKGIFPMPDLKHMFRNDTKKVTSEKIPIVERKNAIRECRTEVEDDVKIKNENLDAKIQENNGEKKDEKVKIDAAKTDENVNVPKDSSFEVKELDNDGDESCLNHIKVDNGMVNSLTPNAPEFVMKSKSNENFTVTSSSMDLNYINPPHVRRLQDPIRPMNFGPPMDNMFVPYQPIPMMYPQNMFRPPPMLPRFGNPMMQGQLRGPMLNPFMLYPRSKFQPPPGIPIHNPYIPQRMPMHSKSPPQIPENMERSKSLEKLQEQRKPSDLMVNGSVHMKVMYILRGLPGSGKTTLARKLKGTTGAILSTDDFFINSRGVYEYNPELLSDAHEWNKKRTRKLVQEGASPIIIDNTNLCAWEMKPYAELAVKNCYQVFLREPDTSWRYKPGILAQKNSHDVPHLKIKQMLDRFEKDLTIEKVLKSGSRPASSNSSEPRSYQLSRPQYNTTTEVAADKSRKFQNRGPRFTRLQDLQQPPPVVKNNEVIKAKAGYNSVNNGPTNTPKDFASSSSDASPDPLSWSTPIASEKVLSDKGSNSVDTMNHRNGYLKNGSKTQQKSQSLNHSSMGLKQLDNDQSEKSKILKESLNNANIKASLESKTTHRFPFKRDHTQNISPRHNKLRAKNNGKNLDILKSKNVELSSDSAPSSANSNTLSPTAMENSTVEKLQKNNRKIADKKPKAKVSETKDKMPKKKPPSDENKVQGLEKKTANPMTAENGKNKTVESKNISENSDTKLNINKTANDVASRHVMPHRVGHPKMAAVFSSGLKLNENKSTALKQIAVDYAESPQTSNDDTADKTEGILSENVDDVKFEGVGKDDVELDATESTEIEMSNIETQTSELDFTIARKVDNGDAVEETNIMVGRPAVFEPVPLSDTRRVGKFDKGSSTKELEEQIQSSEAQVAHDIDTLKLLFDDISVDKLREVYSDCSNNLDWTTNILAESSLFGNNASFSSLIQQKQTLDGTHKVKSDYSCCTNIKDGETAHAEPADASGEPPTEMENISDVCGENSVATQPSPIEVENVTNEIAEIKSNGVVESLEVTPYMSGAASNAVDETADVEETNSSQPIRLKFSRSLIASLVQVFGDAPPLPGFEPMNNTSCAIDVPHDVAKQLHEAWMSTEVKKREAKISQRAFTTNQMRRLMHADEEDRIRTWEMEEARKLHVQLEEDEMFARRLQQAEDRGESEYVKPPLEQESTRRNKKKTEMRRPLPPATKQQPITFGLTPAKNLNSTTASGDRSTPPWDRSTPPYNAWNEKTSSPLITVDCERHNEASIVGAPNSIRRIMEEEVAAQRSQQRQKQSLDPVGLASKLKNAQLKQYYPGLPEDLLDEIFMANNCDLESTVYSINCLWIGDSPPSSMMSERAREIYNEQAIDLATMKSIEEQNVPKLPEPLIQMKQVDPVNAVLNPDETTDELSYEDLRTEANIHKQGMIEAFQKAGIAYRENRRGLAMFYANQGHAHQSLYKEANQRAAELIYKQKNEGRSSDEVDLHGLHVQEAMSILARKISERTRVFNEENRPEHLRVISVITGRGRGSHGGVAKIRQSVQEWLTSKNYRWAVKNAGNLEVKL